MVHINNNKSFSLAIPKWLEELWIWESRQDQNLRCPAQPKTKFFVIWIYMKWENEIEFIENLLAKHKNKACTPKLKKELYEELSEAKESGLITLPFKIFLRKKNRKEGHDYFEIIVDTKI